LGPQWPQPITPTVTNRTSLVEKRSYYIDEEPDSKYFL